MKKPICVILCIIHGLVLTTLWFSGWNQTLFILLNKHFFLADLWANITVLGDGFIGTLILLSSALIFKKKRLHILVYMLSASLFTFLFKSFFSMPRPAAVLPMELIHITGPLLTRHSFPSGHSTTFFMYFFIFAPLIKKQTAQWSILLLSYIGALSRIMVGAHWPADIFGGFINACLAYYFSLYFIRRLSLFTKAHIDNRVLYIILIPSIVFGFFYRTGYPHTLFLQYSVLIITGGLVFLNLKK